MVQICIFLVFKNKNNSHSAWLFHWKIASPLQSKLPAALYYIRYPLNRIGLVEKARVNAAPTFIPQMPTYLGYAAQIERLPGTTACRVQHPNISPKLFFFSWYICYSPFFFICHTDSQQVSNIVVSHFMTTRKLGCDTNVYYRPLSFRQHLSVDYRCWAGAWLL